MGYSARLTTIIAIDRSIRMKNVYKYSSIMTKTKANLALIFNGVLGIVKVAGSLGPHESTFEKAYGIFHGICIFFGCMLYIITYCNTKQKVSDLRSKMGGNHVISVNEAKTYHNSSATSLQPEARVTEEGEFMNRSSYTKNRCHIEHLLTGSQEGDLYRNHPNILGKASPLGISNLFNELQGRAREANLFANNAATECFPDGRGSMADRVHGHQDVVRESRDIHTKAEKKVKNLNDRIHRKGKDNDIGKAMLLIVVVMLLGYTPTLVDGLLRVQNVDSIMLDHFSMITLLANSSCNAIILTAFSRDIRNLAKGLL